MTDKEFEWDERMMLIRGALILGDILTKNELALYVLYGKDAECTKLAAERISTGDYVC